MRGQGIFLQDHIENKTFNIIIIQNPSHTNCAKNFKKSHFHAPFKFKQIRSTQFFFLLLKLIMVCITKRPFKIMNEILFYGNTCHIFALQCRKENNTYSAFYTLLAVLTRLVIYSLLGNFKRTWNRIHQNILNLWSNMSRFLLSHHVAHMLKNPLYNIIKKFFEMSCCFWVISCCTVFKQL